jgi:hypothetical protein
MDCGPLVTAVERPGNPPLATGGAITDGIYVLTALNVYGGNGSSSSFQVQMTQSFANGVRAVSQYWGSTPDYASGPYSIDGNKLTWQLTCPAGEVTGSPGEYTATDSTVVLYEPRDTGSVYEYVHERQ